MWVTCGNLSYLCFSSVLFQIRLFGICCVMSRGLMAGSLSDATIRHQERILSSGPAVDFQCFNSDASDKILIATSRQFISSNLLFLLKLWLSRELSCLSLTVKQVRSQGHCTIYSYCLCSREPIRLASHFPLWRAFLSFNILWKCFSSITHLLVFLARNKYLLLTVMGMWDRIYNFVLKAVGETLDLFSQMVNPSNIRTSVIIFYNICICYNDSNNNDDNTNSYTSTHTLNEFSVQTWGPIHIALFNPQNPELGTNTVLLRMRKLGPRETT